MKFPEILRPFIDLLIPNTCPVCNAFIEERALICKACDNDLIPLEAPMCIKCALPRESKSGVNEVCFRCISENRYFDTIFGAFEYTSAAKKIFARAKFGHREDAVRRLAEIAIHRHLIPLDFLSSHPDLKWTSVPMHPKDLRQRGFNTSRIILDLLKEKEIATMDQNFLKRIQPRIRGNSKIERQRLSQKAFEMRKEREMPKTVVVVDDVMSSGATLSAIARCLKKAGVKNVYGVVLARKD